MKIQQRPVDNTLDLFPGDSSLNRVFAARGIRSVAELDYQLSKLLPPAGLGQIHDAAVMLAEAVMSDANVVVVGDFDADGATSCALAVRGLRAFGLNNVSYLVPNRFEYGYGLSPEIVGVAALRAPDIIVTVDNGISSVNGVYAAQQLGISVLITDHHLPGKEIPQADVIVNPNMPGDAFASKNLAGVGVIFYVMMAVRAELRALSWFEQSGITEPNLAQFLDLVALGTVADVVSLDYNNRLLVQQGLLRICQGQACAGIDALLTVAKRATDRVVASDLGFAVGPRLNAAGRLEDMSLGIECLLSDDTASALEIANRLNDLNAQRRQVEQDMQRQAQHVVDEMLLDESEPACLYVLSDPGWHQGVVGLVASRIKERVNRPVIALAPGEDGIWKGSARSVPGVHIRDLLARVEALHPGLMIKFGGHAMAAGLSIAGEEITQFEIVARQAASDLTRGHDWQPVLWTDGELEEQEITLEFAQQLRDVSPWGQGFEEPIFEGSFEVREARTVGERHCKISVVTADDQQLDAICFFYHDNFDKLPEGRVHLAYRLDVNQWRDQSRLQLIVQHIETLEKA